MKKKFTFLIAAIALMAFLVPNKGWGQTRTEVTDVMNQTWTGVSGSSYTQVTGLEGSASDAVYTVQCAGGNSSIQLRSNNNNSGIVSTTSGGTVAKVTVTWNSNTSNGRTLNVYGSNSAYSAPSDLYGTNAGTLIGTIVCGTSTELTITDSYAYVGMRSASAAMYLDEIQVTWSTGGSSGPVTYTVTYDANGGTGTMTDPNSPYEEDDEVTLLTNTFTAPEGKIWDSWEVKDANDQIITVTGGKFTMPANNVTVKAQWVDDPAAPQINWVLTDLADLTATDVFVIVGTRTDATYGGNYAMSNDKGTSNPPTAVAVTIASDKITSTVSSDIQWNIDGNATDGYTFYPNGSTTTWLYCTDGNNGVRVGTNTNKTFVLASGYLKHSGTSRYVGIYQSQDWRCYTDYNATNIKDQTFAFYKKVTGGVTPPSISADNVSIAYDATNGHINYTINNEPTPAGTLTASIVDGGTIANLALGTIASGAVSFTCDANPTGTARTATVTLTYTYNTDQTVTKNVTITQAGDPNIADNISDITGAGDYHVKGMVVATNSRGFIIGDGTGYVYTYLNAAPTWNVGDNLSITGTTSTSYGHVIQFTSAANVETTSSTNYNGDPQPLAITEVPDYSTGNHLSTYLQFEGTLTKETSGSYTNYNIAVGGSTIRVSYPTDDQITALDALLTKTVRVHGFFAGISGTTFTALMESVEEVVITTPTITLDNYTINAPAEGVMGTINATYENITTVAADVFFCEADGTTAATYSWITANIDASNNVEYLVDANTGDARTAYLKVWAYDDLLNEVYSDLVTINQAKYVIDYATLPFNWAGGPKDDLTALNGVTGNGLGSDYAASNAPYRVKFDTDGDYIQIKTDQQPDVVTIKIKKLGGDGVTSISIQGSVDGTTFTTIQEFQNEGATNAVLTHTTTNAFDPSHRYVRILYNKPTGGANVGVGPISIYPNAPIITVAPDLLEVNSYDHSGSLTATYKMIDFTNTPEVVFFEADGTTAATYDHSWILADVNATTHDVDYVIGENSGVARTAYFKVYGLGTDASDVYSNLVTVTQDEYVVDFATLPFEYDGNGQGVLPSGLTQNGVGSYSGSPAMKFDGTGDYLILKLNEAPTSLSYDIKSNSFSGSTGQFDVLVSSDGTTYSTLVSYTPDDLTNGKVQSCTFVDLASEIRFIKWIYTNKESGGGNIGLGNIRATENYDIYGNVTVDHLNIPVDKVCTIYSGATLNIGINGLSNEGNATNLIIKDGGQLYTPSAVSGTVEKNITGYGNSTGKDGYYLVSAPAKTMISPIDHTDAYHFDAYYQGEEWRNIRQASGPWHISAESAALYASQENRTLSFNGYSYNGTTVINNDLPATNTPINVSVKFNSGKTFEGWNLIGNPFTCKAYLSDKRDFYRMNDDRDGFILNTDANGGGNAINVCEGIFVETTTGETSVTFTTEPPVTSTGNNHGMINISLNQTVNRGEQSLVDNARIRFGEGNAMHKFSFNDNTAKVYFTEGNQDYAVVRSEAQGEMPVNFKAANDGTYTLDFSMDNVEFDYLHLIDNKTGMDIDLLQTPSYTFEATTHDYAARFRLVFSANSVNENSSESFAFISNGQLILTNVDNNTTVQMIDALGRMIVNTEASNRVYTDSMAPGVYVLRLVNGNDVKTQKIVVK